MFAPSKSESVKNRWMRYKSNITFVSDLGSQIQFQCVSASLPKVWLSLGDNSDGSRGSYQPRAVLVLEYLYLYWYSKFYY